MWIPNKLYEALPAIYLTIGVSLILGALYIGISHGLMLGYLMLGAGCMMAAILVKSVRSTARAETDRSRA